MNVRVRVWLGPAWLLGALDGWLCFGALDGQGVEASQELFPLSANEARKTKGGGGKGGKLAPPSEV